MEVGMVLFRQLPVDSLDRLRRGVLLHPEYFVVVPHGMRTIAYPLLFERVLPPHSPAQLGVSPSRPRRPGCTPRAASGRPCGVTRSIATGGFGVAARQTRLEALPLRQGPTRRHSLKLIKKQAR